MLTNRALVSFGNDRIAAMGIASRINMICFMTLIGFAFGAQPLYGYTWGSRDKPRFRKAVRFGFLLEAGLGACFAIILFFASPFLMRLFIDEPAVVEAGTSIIRFMQISSLLMGFSLVTVCVCQAVGHAAGALVLSLCRQGILFFIAISVLPSWLGFNGILLSQPAADLLTGIIAAFIISGIFRKL